MTNKDITPRPDKLASEEVVNQRLLICGSCPFFKLPDKACLKCGCSMDSKFRLKRSECPLGLWHQQS